MLCRRDLRICVGGFILFRGFLSFVFEKSFLEDSSNKYVFDLVFLKCYSILLNDIGGLEKVRD